MVSKYLFFKPISRSLKKWAGLILPTWWKANVGLHSAENMKIYSVVKKKICKEILNCILEP